MRDIPISAIAAIGKNRAIGKDNQLLWDLPKDLKRFSELTTDNIVIMGRRTWESLPASNRPLPNRFNIVISKSDDFEPEGAEKVPNFFKGLQAAQRWLQEGNKGEIFVIGGGQIYDLALAYTDTLYLTVVDDEPEDADTFFPEFKESFTLESAEDTTDNGHDISFQVYKRRAF